MEKQWLRQKLLEYKVKKGDLKELIIRMDIITTSIALAQAAKKWVGHFKICFRRKCYFWAGLERQRNCTIGQRSNKSHKILNFQF